ncbi:unnamed protein product [Rotaria socialis]|uniref:RING-type domain-containing protein n=1 Tax=Rotaria socialis TaxID=392032 RepID=A0A820T9T7_9BILA|nr:unnamed protein product [Rotaria socialis]CAF3296109.1 unnamed protein product [Rotaria socialis]CAF3322213.1 unnamed protein product [Rotaria socialis]CAF3338255.1 unnamed protein product [Rotaria socialis]CAF3491435.1 unnamed protein product [Rotaria socialis]
MTSNDNLNLTLTCAICLDIASEENAVETSCCHNLFCLPCIENVESCPTCRTEDYQKIPAYFARRLIGSLTVSCPNDGCTVQVTRSNLANHLALYCAFNQITCPDPECKNFKCTKKSFLKHLETNHEQFLLDNYVKLWQKQDDTKRMVIIKSDEEPNGRVEASATNIDSTFDDRIEKTRNKSNRYARLGSTGKFYCGGPLDGLRCMCCNNRCGPSNGCNCSACMLLDVQKRKLPHGWLVNCDGASARCSTSEPSKFYCGRMVMAQDSRTDGYCGPTNGEQCTACQKLNEQRYHRYGQI